MAIKSVKEKLKNHDSTGKTKKITAAAATVPDKEVATVNTEFEPDSDTNNKDIVPEVVLDEFDTVRIYKNEVIFDENNPEDNPPTSLQMYQGESFLMCPPFGASNAVANNDWMSDEDEPIDRMIYMEEWLRLYKDLSSVGMVYLAPTHPKLQDQVYISNGMWIPFHQNDYCLMPNFKVEGRKENKDLGIPGENAINGPFMQMLGYKVTYMPKCDENNEPMYFEGSADIKMINCDDPHGCVYVCGTGIRTSENAARWIENWLNEIDTDENSHHKVISYPQTNPLEYHLDCSIEPIDTNHTLVSTLNLDPKVLEEISKYTTVIPCDEEDILNAGLCNFLRAGNTIFMSSDINLLEGSVDYAEDYNIEKRRIEFMQKVCNQVGLNLSVYCLSEALKGGAVLSCNVCDLRGWAFIKEKDWAFKY